MQMCGAVCLSFFLFYLKESIFIQIEGLFLGRGASTNYTSMLKKKKYEGNNTGLERRGLPACVYLGEGGKKLVRVIHIAKTKMDHLEKKIIL